MDDHNVLHDSVIETVEELDALPAGLDEDSDPWWKWSCYRLP